MTEIGENLFATGVGAAGRKSLSIVDAVREIAIQRLLKGQKITHSSLQAHTREIAAQFSLAQVVNVKIDDIGRLHRISLWL